MDASIDASNKMYPGLTLGNLLFLIGAGTGIGSIAITKDDDPLKTAKILVQSMKKPAAVVGTDEHVLFCNAHLEEFLGYTLGELRQMAFREFTVKKYINTDVKLFEDVLDPSSDLEFYKYTKAWIHADGHHVYGDLTVIPFVQNKEVLFTMAWIDSHKDMQEGSKEVVSELYKENDPIWIKIMRILDNSKRLIALSVSFGLLALILAVAWKIEEVLEIVLKITSSP